MTFTGGRWLKLSNVDGYLKLSGTAYSTDAVLRLSPFAGHDQYAHFCVGDNQPRYRVGDNQPRYLVGDAKTA